MEELIKLLFRIMFMPIALMLIGGTAILEFLSRKPDWKYWRNFNRPVIEMLPFKINV